MLSSIHRGEYTLVTPGVPTLSLTPRGESRTGNLMGSCHQKYFGNIIIFLCLFAMCLIPHCIIPKWAPKPLFLHQPTPFPTPRGPHQDHQNHLKNMTILTLIPTGGADSAPPTSHFLTATKVKVLAS